MLQSISLHGEVGSVDAGVVAEGIKDICNNLNDYNLSKIYSFNEPGLPLKLFPRRINVIKTEINNSICDMKIVSVKDYITRHICTKPNETNKLPLAFIERPNNPISSKPKNRVFHAFQGGTHG